jgi:patatin-like phospholipase/acyl hydrolase
MNYQKMKYLPLCWLLCITIKGLAATCQVPIANPNSYKKFRILSIDGGGVRGVIPARILQAIEEQTGKPICELFDLVIGNSTGGLIALALLTPDQEGRPKYKAADLVEFYKQKTPKIFSSSIFHHIKTGWGLWGPRYNRKHLDRILKELFDNAKLSHTLKPAVVISFSLDCVLPEMWSTHHAREGIKLDYYLSDVAGATSAAPTYFSPKVLKNIHGEILHEIDGGIWANNPEFTAIRALSFMKHIPKEQDVILISIGTGAPKLNERELQKFRQQAAKLKNAGILGWMIKAQPNLIEMMMTADSDWSKDLISIVYPNSHRIQVHITQALSSMDNAKNVEKLRLLAEEYIATDSFKELCDKLVQP